MHSICISIPRPWTSVIDGFRGRVYHHAQGSNALVTRLFPLLLTVYSIGEAWDWKGSWSELGALRCSRPIVSAAGQIMSSLCLAAPSTQAWGSVYKYAGRQHDRRISDRRIRSDKISYATSCCCMHRTMIVAACGWVCLRTRIRWRM